MCASEGLNVSQAPGMSQDSNREESGLKFVVQTYRRRRAAAVMSLIQSARLNGLDPYAYLRDVLQRLLTHKNHLIAELLPYRWTPAD